MNAAAAASPQIAEARTGAYHHHLAEALRPFAALARVCDHFHRADEATICSWRIEGERYRGPTAGDCRKAQAVLDGIVDVQAEGEPEIRDVDLVILGALRAETRRLLKFCTESQVGFFARAFPGGVENMGVPEFRTAFPLIHRTLALNAKVERAGGAC